MSIYFNLLHTITHKKDPPLLQLQLYFPSVTSVTESCLRLWRSVRIYEQKTQERATWGAKQEMEDCFKNVSWMLFGPRFSCQLQRPKDNVRLTCSGQQQGMLGNPDAVFTMGFGNKYNIVFLIVIMALRGIKCLCSFQWNIKFEV